jgi:hypothetical protein
MVGMGWLTSLLRGGEGEVGWDDLVKRAVDAMAPLGHHGARGERVFPSDVLVVVTVPERSVEVARGFADDPRFDREVAASLANRCDVAVAELPLREYRVAAGERLDVAVTEQAPRPWELAIEGGDLAGRVHPIPTGAMHVTFGRGAWHGPDGGVRNDLVVCERTAFVSRRAGALHRAGPHLEVASLDQGDLLLVRRPEGEVVRPARTSRGRVALRPGDAIELSDGREESVRLIARRAAVG